jgi:hypothetical protein
MTVLVGTYVSAHWTAGSLTRLRGSRETETENKAAGVRCEYANNSLTRLPLHFYFSFFFFFMNNNIRLTLLMKDVVLTRPENNRLNLNDFIVITDYNCLPDPKALLVCGNYIESFKLDKSL